MDMTEEAKPWLDGIVGEAARETRPRGENVLQVQEAIADLVTDGLSP